jgi:YD repeat-containing protein
MNAATSATGSPGHSRTALCAAIGALLATSAHAQSTTNYVYDAQGRLTSVSRSDGPATAYAYDGAHNRTQRTTAIIGTAPDAFVLGGPASAASGTWASSNIITISGVSAAVPVSIIGGRYRINAGAWQTTTGSVASGQTLQVQAQAPAAGGASQTATLEVGGVSGTFTVTSIIDTTPDAFNLGGPASVTPGAWAQSAVVTIAGINTSTSISITGGEYRINGGTWQSGAGSVLAGQTLQVRIQAPAAGAPDRTATLNVGGVSGAFTVKSVVDATPDAFNLGAPASVAPGAWALSSTVTVTGIDVPVPISITGGEYRINGGTWQSAAASVSVGQTVQVRALAPGVGGASTTATLSIGGVTGTFQATATATGPVTTPNPFNLGGPVYTQPSMWEASHIVTISGITVAVPVSVAGGQYRINSGAWQTSNGSISAGQTIQIRVRAGLNTSDSRTGTLTVGGLARSFTVYVEESTGPCIPAPGQETCSEV